MKRPRPPRADLSKWQRNADGSRSRVYGSYEEYKAHQASKLETMTPEKLKELGEHFREALISRLTQMARPWGAVLCLGARGGAEVEAFQHVGCLAAIGVDLNPASPLVMAGDFHDLAFESSTFDTVYTNSLDHAFDLGRVLSEVRRVLRPSGCLIVEATTKALGEYESFAWESIDGLLTAIESRGFRLLVREHISEPWIGEQLVMVRA
jgi:SAM-dependent methyltransferase